MLCFKESVTMTTTYEVGNPIPGLGQAPTYDGVKPVKVIPTLLS
jgi:hypothetical protein